MRYGAFCCGFQGRDVTGPRLRRNGSCQHTVGQLPDRGLCRTPGCCKDRGASPPLSLHQGGGCRKKAFHQPVNLPADGRTGVRTPVLPSARRDAVRGGLGMKPPAGMKAAGGNGRRCLRHGAFFCGPLRGLWPGLL